MNTPDLLLCVDLQPVFIRVMSGPDQLIQRTSLAIAAAQGLQLPILFTEQVPHKLGETSPELLALAPAARVFAKTSFSAWADESVRDAIAAFAPQRILICGLETPVCIYQSTLDALNAGYHVTLLRDAIGARRSVDAADCLAALRQRGAEILPVETVFYALLKNVQHPFFKAYTQLVKAHG